MVLNWHHDSRLDLYWIQSGVNLTPEFYSVAFEMRCYRKVLNITWKDKIRNEDVLLRISSCKFKPKRILARITESQLSWFGHVCRMSNMRLPKRILMEMVPGTIRQGRPRKRWEDDIIAGTFLEAYRNAEDRNRWADFVHGANVLWDTVQRWIDSLYHDSGMYKNQSDGIDLILYSGIILNSLLC